MSGPHLYWRIGNHTVQGTNIRTESSVVSNYTFGVVFEDHAKRLECVVSHEHWNTTVQPLTCDYDRLNVTFKPKLICPR